MGDLLDLRVDGGEAIGRRVAEELECQMRLTRVAPLDIGAGLAQIGQQPIHRRDHRGRGFQRNEGADYLSHCRTRSSAACDARHFTSSRPPGN